uniref:RNA-directed DNA polymerase n=1 Tax=Trichuris muris TaxID=70415 RepID=A0A5S6R425_TRIMR
MAESVTVISAFGEESRLEGSAIIRLKIAILGHDFLMTHGWSIDYAKNCLKQVQGAEVPLLVMAPAWEPKQTQEGAKHSERYFQASAVIENDDNLLDDCAVSNYGAQDRLDMPQCASDYYTVVEQFKELFTVKPGATKMAYRVIPTADSPPVRVPPRRLPAHFRHEVEAQLQTMLEHGIIQPSNSPWLAPAVFTRKKSGELRFCVDYRQLNKRTIKDAYPLPLPDEVQDRLGGATVFSTLDLNSGFWQLPIHPDDRHKTAFCPGPGLGLYEFCRMPFGLCGGPSSFQRLMDTVLRGLPFAMVYLDDVLIFSENQSLHCAHLKQVFHRCQTAGLTLRGSKCQIGRSEVRYLGHIFSRLGMSVDPLKTAVVANWPRPLNVTDVRRFLGLASYYRRYIKSFATIAKPLHQLTEHKAEFKWDQDCDAAFRLLKQSLSAAPTLASPDFGREFQLHTDASDVGLGAVLEQDGHVISHASRLLRKSEKHYSTIEKECLALMFAVKQFRHYLLAKHFTVWTDHCPLQWLSGQKMEGRLARWAIALQEFDFTINYKRGLNNGNADALSRVPHQPVMTASLTGNAGYLDSPTTWRTHQANDATLSQVIKVLKAPTPMARWPPAYRRHKTEMVMHDNIVFWKPPAGNCAPVDRLPVAPPSLRPAILALCHDVPTAGHMGFQRTLDRVRRTPFWPGFREDVRNYCESCSVCQRVKAPALRPPMQFSPIGRPWERLAVDVLQLPPSRTGKTYVLTVQDYFTKWLVVRPISNQSAEVTVDTLLQIFTDFGPPQILHSDQGRNFESLLLKQLCSLFGIRKTRCSPYHPEGNGLVERGNRTIIQVLQTLSCDGSDWEMLLPYAVYAYNTSVHAVTGYAPIELMFHRPVPCLQLQPDRPNWAYSVDDYYDALKWRAAHSLTKVRHKLQQVATQLRHRTDAAALAPPILTSGTPVFVKREVRHKLQPKWQPGWTVVQQYDSGTVRVRDGNGNEKVLNLAKVRPVETMAVSVPPAAITHVPADPIISPSPITNTRSSRNRRSPAWLSDYVVDIARGRAPTRGGTGVTNGSINRVHEMS